VNNSNSEKFNPSRRNLILKSLAAAGASTTPYLVSGCAGNSPTTPINSVNQVGDLCIDVGPLPTPSCGSLANIGDLQAADANGVRLPPGFTSRVIAQTGKEVGNTGYIWPTAPDGSATYATNDGGYIVAVNHEASANAGGGVSSIRFDSNRNIVDAYRICEGTDRNCAGGKTPWHTWLTCEEDSNDGFVWECDPWGCSPAVIKPKLGAFNHEAVAVDPINKILYLTEDAGNGLFYRFVPSASDWPEGEERPALEDGVLEAFVSSNPTSMTSPTTGTWTAITDPDLNQTNIPTSSQGALGGATTFNGGEGIWYHDGLVYFTTKGDAKVWLWDTNNETMQEVYDGLGILNGSDNLTITCHGDVLVAEDPGDQQVVVLYPDGTLKPLLQFEGHTGSEVTGPCLSPDGTRLYVHSQRGADVGELNTGTVFEITFPAFS
jgi:secreted PhoX family phosphatase